MMTKQTHPAGNFSDWLKTTRDTLSHNQEIDVPCGSCTACCHSAYFIHIQPHETDTLARIPKAHQFPAPGLPEGHVVLGYDEKGRCPMFKNKTCTIYEHRPLTCRTYDCRIFSATGLLEDDASKTLVNERVQRWQFDYPTEQDRSGQKAVLEAVNFLKKFAKHFPAWVVPGKLAAFAIKVYPVFLDEANTTLTELDKVKLVMETVKKIDGQQLR